MAITTTVMTNVVVPGAPLAWPTPEYACALAASDIDLSLRDDLSASVQDYLMRITDELQQLGKWAAACQSRVVRCEQQQQQRPLRDEQRDAVQQLEAQHAQQAGAALLLAQTETQLLRGEMQRLVQELAQRAAAQLAYGQNAARIECGELVADAERRFERELLAATQQAHAHVDSARADADVRWQSADAALRAATQRLDSQQAQLAQMKTQLAEALPAVETTLRRQQLELTAQQRRLDQLEAAVALQLGELSGATRESLAGLRDMQTQLAAKLQVVRSEMQQQQRTGDGDGPYRQFNGQLKKTEARVHQSPRGDTAGDVVMAVGAAALSHDNSSGGAGDCFLYAKAALAPRSSSGDAPRKDAASSRQVFPSPTMMAMSTSVVPLPLRATAKCPTPGRPGSLEAALRIHASTLSQPVGRKEDEGAIGLSRPLSASTASSVSARKASLRGHDVQQATRPQIPRRETHVQR